MRNLAQYPITQDEKIKLIEKLQAEALAHTQRQQTFGDIRPAILRAILEDLKNVGKGQALGQPANQQDAVHAVDDRAGDHERDADLGDEARDPQLKKWWVSWWFDHVKHGPFELHSPWWVSGERMSDSALSICAAMIGSDEEYIKKRVAEAYDVLPEDLEFRFIEQRPDDWLPYSERFPRADWMKW